MGNGVVERFNLHGAELARHGLQLWHLLVAHDDVFELSGVGHHVEDVRLVHVPLQVLIVLLHGLVPHVEVARHAALLRRV